MAIHIQVTTLRAGRPAPASLCQSWEDCLSRCPARLRLFTLPWFQAWLTHYASARPWLGILRLLEARNDAGQTLGLLPLAERRQKGIRILSLGGFYQPLRTGLIADDAAGEVAAAMASALRQQRDWDILRLAPTDTANGGRAALDQALQAAFRTVTVPLGRTIVNRVEDEAAIASSKTFKRIRSYERKFLREPAHRIVYLPSPTGDALERALRDMGTVEAASWLARENGDLRFASAKDRAFWTEAATTSLCPHGQLHIWMAYAGDRPLAFRVILRSGDIDYMIANQFDEAFAEHRPGWILYLRHLDALPATGVTLIDSAPGDLHYKGRLGGEEAEMRIETLVFARTLRGQLAFLVKKNQVGRCQLSVTTRRPEDGKTNPNNQ